MSIVTREPERSGSDRLPRHHFRQDGTGKAVFGIAVRNFALGILTLGIYRFWGVTRLRRYLWSSTRFLDDPLEYLGTGKELFIGAVVAFAVLFAIVFTTQIGFLIVLGPEVEELRALPGLIVGVLVPVAIYRARRYRLSRTAWRGIRAGQTGSALKYAVIWLAWTASLFPSFGLSWPLRAVALARYTMNHTMFGDRFFTFEGKATTLYRPFLVAWGAAAMAVAAFAGSVAVLQPTVPEAGEPAAPGVIIGFLALMLALLLISFWYRAAQMRFVARHTRFGDLSFSADIRGRQLAWLWFSNFLIVLLTLGLGLPYALLRGARLAAAALTVHGDAAAITVAQNALTASKTGEGLASLLDVDAF